MPGFAELAARSHYSFLEGAASPRRMVETAARLGISALGLCDRNGLYGAVELIQAAKAQGIHPIIGTELELAGGSRLRLLARSRTGYRQLCRAVSASQLAGVKGQPRLQIAGIATGAGFGDRASAIRTGPAVAGTAGPVLGSTRTGSGRLRFGRRRDLSLLGGRGCRLRRCLSRVSRLVLIPRSSTIALR